MTKFNFKKIPRLLLFLAAALFWLGVWTVAALCVGKEWILPNPWAVVCAFFASFEGGALPLYLLRSTLGIGAGYLAGVAVGFLLAAVTAKVEALHVLFSPLLTVVRATPIASFILILWIVLARETVPAFSVALIVLPIIWGNCETGFRKTDRQLREVAQVCDFSFARRLRFLYLPSVAPYFKTAALTALGMAWKAGVAAEVICTPDGTIGRMIWASKRDIETAELFAWTMAIILVCFALERLLRLLFSAFDRRKREQRRRGAGTKKEAAA